MAKKRVLGIIGGLYHPFEACGEILKRFVEATGRYSVHVTEERDALKGESLKKYSAVVVYAQGGRLSKGQLAGLLGFVRHGGAFVGLHSAAASWRANAAYVEMLGAAFRTHGPVIDFPVNVTGTTSPITARIPAFRITDELYLLDQFDPTRVALLATAMWKGKTQPIAYTKDYGKGKVFYLALGHDERAFSHPEFQKMVVRGLDWALGRKGRAPITVGAIGYGGAFHMGKLHFDSMTLAGLVPTAVCEPIAARRKAAREEFPGVATYASATQMLRKSGVELLVIITPHNTHAKLAIECLKAGRHVVCEKPFCITVKEADAMIGAAKRANRMLSVFHNRRWDGDYLAIKDIIARGFLGEVFHIEACMGGYGHPGYWWRSDKRVSGGAFYDWGAHVVDWVLGLVPSEIKEISGYFQSKRVWHDVTNEDHCNAVIRFANGCCANIELSSLAAVGKRRWRILGTHGALEDVGEGKFRVVSFKDGIRTDSEIPYMESDWHAYYRNVADHLYLDEPLAVTPESARRVIGVIEAAEKSSRAGKALAPPRSWA
ncbi:MAG TPA: Gfo/Idh/MocA family oxidoreductase [Candidatus Hydrogenedentes bacterium]|nr:Gfo/Idh/MocA family oxidoreductase [Candidatus Hydrogenedentota bacterium]